MLQAILHGKAGRVEIDGQVRSWREIFRNYEDPLTAVFFGRFQYLSSDAQNAVLQSLLEDIEIPSLGELVSIVYWPKHGGVAGRVYVEPDILIQFTKALLVVEVKAPSGTQELHQWQSEVKALLAQAELEAKDRIILLALGGVKDRWQRDADALRQAYPDLDLNVRALNWGAVSNSVSTFLEKSEDKRDSKIFEDWLAAFRLYGIRMMVRPFAQMSRVQLSPDWRSLIARMPAPKTCFEGSSAPVPWGDLSRFNTLKCGVLTQWQ